MCLWWTEYPGFDYNIVFRREIPLQCGDEVSSELGGNGHSACLCMRLIIRRRGPGWQTPNFFYLGFLSLSGEAEGSDKKAREDGLHTWSVNSIAEL